MYGPTRWHFSLGSLQSFATEHPRFMEDPAWVATSLSRRAPLLYWGSNLGSLQSPTTEHPCFIEDPAWVATSLSRRAPLLYWESNLGSLQSLTTEHPCFIGDDYITCYSTGYSHHFSSPVLRLSASGVYINRFAFHYTNGYPPCS